MHFHSPQHCCFQRHCLPVAGAFLCRKKTLPWGEAVGKSGAFPTDGPRRVARPSMNCCCEILIGRRLSGSPEGDYLERGNCSSPGPRGPGCHCGSDCLAAAVAVTFPHLPATLHHRGGEKGSWQPPFWGHRVSLPHMSPAPGAVVPFTPAQAGQSPLTPGQGRPLPAAPL